MLKNDTRMKVKNKATYLVLYYFARKGMVTTEARW